MDYPGRSKKDRKKLPDLPKEEKPAEAPTVLRKPASVSKGKTSPEAPTVVKEKPSIPKEPPVPKKEYHSVPREKKPEKDNGEEKKPPPDDPREFDPDEHEFPESPEIPEVLEYKLDVIISYLHKIRKAIPVGIGFGLGCGFAVGLCLLIFVIITVVPVPWIPFTPVTATATPTATPTLLPTPTPTPTSTPVSVILPTLTQTPADDADLAPTATATATATPTEMSSSPEKQFLTWIGRFFGGWKHLVGESLVQWVTKVYGGDPEPVPNAQVTVRLDGPDGSETMTATTDEDGMAFGEFTIYSYGSYTLTIENIDAVDFAYTPELNAYNSISVEVVEGDNPPPLVTGETVSEFASLLAASMRLQDAPFLFERLHPQVIELYGEDVCQSYLSGLSDPTFAIKVEGASGPATWTWEREGQTMEIDNVYTVRVFLTSQGETSPVEMHMGLMDDGTLRWFTDCDGP